jgi:prophage regulatory protein
MATKNEKAQKPTRKKITYTPAPLPDEGFVRLPSVLKVLGISKTGYLDGVKSGKYPEGKLLSPRCRVYPVSEIRALLSSVENEEIVA